MAEDTIPADTPETPPSVPAKRARLHWSLRLIGGIVGLLLFLAAAIGFGVDTDAGHRFIVDRIGEMKPSSGLRIHIGRIDGSIWRHAQIRDLRLSDPQGIFLEAPIVDLDWRPTRWLANRLHVDRLASDLVILKRLPKLRPARPGAPILPDYRIHIGQLDLRLRLEAGVAGPQRRLVRIVGKADTGNRRAVIGLRGASSAGDRLTFALDTEPDKDLFDLDARLASPGDGVVPGLLGSKKPMAVVVGGEGNWSGWKGRGLWTVGGHRIGALMLRQDKGHYALSGRLTLGTITGGKAQRLTNPSILVSGEARYADRRLDGSLKLASPQVAVISRGAIDLARGAYDPLKVDALLLQPAALFPNMTGHGIRIHAELDGPFKTARFRYDATSPQFAFDKTGFEQVRAEGAGHVGGKDLALPIKLTARRVTGVGDVAGGILANMDIQGVLHITPKVLTGEGLTLRSDKLNGKVALFVDLVGGKYWVDLSGGLQRYLIPGLGIVDVLTELKVTPTADLKQSIVSGRGRAWVRRFDNAFLRSLAGGLPTLDTQLTRTPDGILHFANLRLTAAAITITGSGTRQKDGSIQFTGQGKQATYGTFRLGLGGQIDHPKVALLLDRPLEALGLDQVKLDLDPVPQGFAMQAAGGSTLGPFTATGTIDAPPGGTTVIHMGALNVSGTTAKGDLRADPGGFTGQLALAGGGLGGTLDFSPVGTQQRIVGHITADHARLAGDFDTSVRKGKLDLDLLLDPAGTHVDATVAAQGLRRGSIFLARLAANTKLRGGIGDVRASVAGSRGRAFSFQTDTHIAAESYTVRGQGQVDGRPVALATAAVLRHVGDAWVIAPTSLSFSGGSATVAGRFGTQATSFEASLDAMPLSVLDMFKPGLGLSGQATGRVSYAVAAPGALPTGKADLRVRGLSRAGLVLSSKPVDVGLAAVMDGGKVAARAVATSGGQVIGRAQARLSPIGGGATIADRLLSAPLFAQLRYNGPADTLWRLSGIETIDLSGPVAIGADVGGTLRDPSIRGSLVTQNARLESATLGTVIEKIRAAGRFDGSKLLIDQFAGATRDNGTLTGRASFDFAGAKGLGMDIALTANHAVLLARDDIGATVTGPLTIKSDGKGGTIAGDVKLDRSSYRFGKAAQQGVPRLAVKELNREDFDDEDTPLVPWTLDIKADARNQLFVRGLGLDSEWRGKLAIAGSVDNPAITGRIDLVRGNYEFAGRRFDLDRGIIRFGGGVPVDPALDIVAKASIQGVSASIQVSGTGLKPEISFTSTPALPEDELLSRLLFGTSIANLSAPEALQLAAAVNGLRTGGKGSLDPINAIRKVAGLDRLRIEPADITTGQKTSVAAGKYIGKRLYVELVTDGQGYSATRLEFQVTRWLSLLSTISTIGRQSANIRISKDY
ncbi:translocation/assembly module TamB domain-containing protein [Sphingomonas oryzagri]|uniref:Translocation/assembly module TamB domain-containing protein n=1 Tax=Sphingomonas oryzagri TaxID=3042314 RepID=A0ABT6N3P1_9SPHN|nr:translocation/assembly module TamB domain-containing protein [Sphingomonas oryzagri]MDH7639671.1 translocation/assembly module TamB domain-containing protein [Sphingomonas oryzagri]